MELKQQVVSLELAKKLNELGVKQESLFVWSKTKLLENNEKYPDNIGYELIIAIEKAYKGFANPIQAIQDNTEDGCSAFTVAEIGEVLWKAFDKCGWKKFFFVYGEVFSFKGTSFVGELGIVNFMRKPDMGAKMLAYLLEKGIIKVEDINR